MDLYDPPEISGLLDQVNTLAKSLAERTPGARERLVTALRSLTFEVERPRDSIWRTLGAEPAHHVIIRIATDLKFWQHLAAENEAPKSSEQVAQMCSANPRLVTFKERMLKHLAAMGTIKELDVNLFANTPMSSSFAREEYFYTIKFLAETYLPMYLKTPDYFRQVGYAEPNDVHDTILQYTFDCKGMSFFEWGATHGEPPITFQFGKMMNAFSQNPIYWMDEGYYPVHERLARGARTDKEAVLIVDVGGSYGHDLERFRSKHPDIPGRLVLQDKPEIIAQAKPDVGIEPTVHDFFTTQPVRGARAYYMHSVLHDWSDDQCRSILEKLKPALEPGYSKILVQEMVIPNKDAHWSQTSLDWNLLTGFGGREREEQEWRILFDSAGLKISGIFKHPLSRDSLIEVELL